MFNRLAGRMISIVDAKAGITRDRLSVICHADDRYFELVDTGGYGIEDLDALGPEVERQIRFALDRADLIIFLVDVQSGITPLDRRVADILRREQVPVLVVANKVDDRVHEYAMHEFESLGLGVPQPISALHGTGISDLLEEVARRLPPSDEQAPAEPIMQMAIVGPRNAGKSTFINTLAGEERVIVSEIPGTTRDAVDVRFQIGNRTFLAIDTAGVRKKGKIRESVDFYSYVRAERSIRRADVILLMVDASQPIAQITKKLAGYITENCKPCVIVINKWDLAVGKADIQDYAEYVEKTMPGLSFAPISLTCAKDAINVQETVKLAYKLFEQASTRVSTGQLNEAIEEIRKAKAPSGAKSKARPRFYYATQIGVRPPTIVLFVNDRQAFGEDYQRFIVNRFRDLLPFAEVPIRLMVRERTRSQEGGKPPGKRPPKA